MLYNNFNEEILGLQHVEVKKLETTKEKTP